MIERGAEARGQFLGAKVETQLGRQTFSVGRVSATLHNDNALRIVQTARGNRRVRLWTLFRSQTSCDGRGSR